MTPAEYHDYVMRRGHQGLSAPSAPDADETGVDERAAESHELPIASANPDGGSQREGADNLNHSRHWSLPDIGGYPVGSPKLYVLREAGEL